MGDTVLVRLILALIYSLSKLLHKFLDFLSDVS